MRKRNVVSSNKGFSLVEIMVAVTIMMVTLMALAAGTAAVARMSNGSADRVQRTTSMDDYTSSLYSMPWDSLPDAGKTCEDIAGAFPYERCLSVTDISASEKQLLVVVTPVNHRIAADTITIERGRAVGANPLNTN